MVLVSHFCSVQANGGDVFGLSALANTHASIIEHLISHADWFFPGEVLITY